MRKVIFIHGINTGITRADWSIFAGVQFEELFPPLRAFTRKYKAGAFPYWNNLVINPRVSKVLAVDIISKDRPGDVYDIVAHSNGCPIAKLLAKRLAKAGIPVNTIIMIGSAEHSDVKKSGLAKMVDKGDIVRVFAYCDPGDKVTKYLEWLPFSSYGNMGAKGLRYQRRRKGITLIEDTPFDQVPNYELQPYVTRIFEGVGHSGLLNDEREATFQLIADDLGLSSKESQ
jgi:pimeloyl-ACP methyl ester carboxylesterase